jgi:hypothetical protein
MAGSGAPVDEGKRTKSVHALRRGAPEGCVPHCDKKPKGLKTPDFPIALSMA